MKTVALFMLGATALLALFSSKSAAFSSSRALFSSSSSDDDDDCNVVDAARAYWHNLNRNDHEGVAALFHRNAVSYRNGMLDTFNGGQPFTADQSRCAASRVDQRRVLQSIGRDRTEGRRVSLNYDLYIDESEPIGVVHTMEFDRASCSISVERIFHATDGEGLKRFVRRTANDCFGEEALDGGFIDHQEVLEQCWSSFVQEDAEALADCFAADAVWYNNGVIAGADMFTAGYWEAYFEEVEVLSADMVLSTRNFAENRVSMLVEWQYRLRGDKDNQVFTTFSAQNAQINEDGKLATLLQVSANQDPIQRALGAVDDAAPAMLSSFSDSAAAFRYTDVMNIFGAPGHVIEGEVAIWGKQKNYGLASVQLRDESVDIGGGEITHIRGFADVSLSSERAAAAQAVPGVYYNRVKQELTARGGTVGELVVNMYYAMSAADGSDLQDLLDTREDAILSAHKLEGGRYVVDASGEVQYNNNVVLSYASKLRALVSDY